MSEIKRWNVYADMNRNIDPCVRISPAPNGRFVAHKDHAAEVERLEALAGKLVEALKSAKAKIDDMRILFTEAAELEGLTVFVCGDKFNPQEIDAALKAWRERNEVKG